MVHKIKNLTQMRICIPFWVNMKGKMWKYGMEIFQPRATESGNACTTVPSLRTKDTVDMLSDNFHVPGFLIMYQSSIIINTRVIFTTMANRKEMSSQQSSKKLKERGKTDQRH